MSLLPTHRSIILKSAHNKRLARGISVNSNLIARNNGDSSRKMSAPKVVSSEELPPSEAK